MWTFEGTTMHPRCRHIGACWDLHEWLQLFGTNQYSISNFKKKYFFKWIFLNSNFFEEKNQIFLFPCCSTCEDLSIDVSITYVGLILMKLGWFQLFGTSQNTSQNSISNFLEKKLLGFQCCSTREDLSIDVSITNVELILTKLRWFPLFVTNQNSNFELFWKKFNFLGFHGVILVKTFLLMYHLLM